MAEVEDVIRRIRDVRGVRVSTQGGEISEVHVVGAPGRPANKIVRDIVSALNVSLGRAIDYRKISIVQMAEVAATPTAPEAVDLRPVVASAASAGTRPRFDGVTLAIQGTRTRADVELHVEDAGVSASAAGSVRPGAALRVVAEATLRAAGRCVVGAPELELADVFSVPTPLGPAIVVAVRAVNGRAQQELIGAALDRGDPHQAAAAAALDAVNRVLAALPICERVEYVVD